MEGDQSSRGGFAIKPLAKRAKSRPLFEGIQQQAYRRLVVTVMFLFLATKSTNQRPGFLGSLPLRVHYFYVEIRACTYVLLILYSYNTVMIVIFFVGPLCLAGCRPHASFGADDDVCARRRRLRLWTRRSKAFPMRGEGSKTWHMVHYTINTIILLVVVLTHAAVVHVVFL